jgi:hypothetical protein
VRYFVAQDTFSIDLPGGGSRTVVKGATLPESDAVVQQVGEGALFRLHDAGEAPAPVVKPRVAARAAAKAEKP